MNEALSRSADALVGTSNSSVLTAVVKSNIADRKRIMLIVPGRLFRNGIESVLRGSGRIIIGDCAHIDQVEATLGALPSHDAVPDLFVISLAASGQTEHEFARIRALRAKMPASRWIMLCHSADIGFLRDAIESGINALLLEDSPGEALHFAADLVMRGLSFVSVDLAKIMAAALPSPAAAEIQAPAATWCKLGLTPDRLAPPAIGAPREWQVNLSDRESEILQGLIAGHPNKLIARDLRIAEATVKVHVKALLRKMQVTNRTQAAISALQFLRSTEDRERPERMLRPVSVRDDSDRPLLTLDTMPPLGEMVERIPQHSRYPNDIGD